MTTRARIVTLTFIFFIFSFLHLLLPLPASATRGPSSTGMILWEGHGIAGGVSRQSYQLIDSLEEWTNLWNRLEGQKPSAPPDFTRERGVVIYTGERLTAGFSVVFLPPRLDGSRLFVDYCIVSPKGPAAQVVTRAWGMVIVPRTPSIHVAQKCSGIKDAGLGARENDAFSEAAGLGKVETLRRLLVGGIPINGRDSVGKTALMEAVIGNKPDTVLFLLAHGAKVDAPMEDGTTALFFTAFNGRPEITKILLDHGADIALQARGACHPPLPPISAT